MMLKYFPKFNEQQLERLSDVLGNMSVACFLAIILPALFQDNVPDAKFILRSLIIAVLFLSFSLLIIKKKKETE